ncbi:hypothetical protein WJX77_006050 [Trebouxia sp. C0004]
MQRGLAEEPGADDAWGFGGEHKPQWLTASDVGVDSEAVRQEVLQEVLQAMTLNSSTASNVDFNSLSVKAVVGVAKQQLESACQAAHRDKEAAVSRSMQSVQRRASKEALHQADLKVARAQHAASNAAQRSDEEVNKLRRELDFMKKEKKGLVQRCTSAERELGSSMMAQEQLQQQLSGAKAACKASDSRCAQLQAQHQVQLNEVTQQLQAAKQHTEHLAQQHQQALADQLASASVAIAAEHSQEDNHHSQVNLREQLQQLQLEVAAIRGANTSGSEGEEGGKGVQQVLNSLIEVQQQLIGEGCAGLGGLVQERDQVRAQMVSTKRHCYELQQQLQEQREMHDREGSDMARMTHKVHSLEYDLGSLRHSLQAKGQEQTALQSKCKELQQEVDLVQAQHAKELSKALSHQQQLQEQLQQRDVAVQQLQNQVYAAVQYMEQLQQLGQAQAMHAYKSAVHLSCDRLQGLKDRYFNSLPTASFTNGKQGTDSVLKLQREGIVSAYTDFQQRRGSITSMHTMPAAGTCSPSSSLRRGYLTAGSQGSLQQPLLHLPSHLDSPGRNVPTGSRFMDSKKSLPAPVSRTSSSAAVHRQGNLEQPFASRHGTAASPVSCDSTVLPQQSDGILHAESALPSGQSIAEQLATPGLPLAGTSGHADNAQSWQHDTASIALHPQQLASFASALSDTSPVSSMANWHILDVQPEPGWSTPMSEQLLQFEGCMLNALTGLLTQKPSTSVEHGSARPEAKKRGQGSGARQQVWPRAAEDSQQSAQGTTGEMVRAMSAQKKDLTRRLKAAESTNRQLRSELQDFRAGHRWVATPGPLPTDRSPSAATDRPSSNVKSSWQEMAAVLDMLQDISVLSEYSQPGRPASARSPSVSPTRRKPRCASAFGPSSTSGADGRQPKRSSVLSDYGSPAKAKVGQEGCGVQSVQQQLCSGLMSSDGSLWSGTPVKGSFKKLIVLVGPKEYARKDHEKAPLMFHTVFTLVRWYNCTPDPLVSSQDNPGIQWLR